MIIIYFRIKKKKTLRETFALVQSVIPVECEIVEQIFHDIPLTPSTLLFTRVRWVS